MFAALSMCLRVPVFENYYLCLGYIVMTVYTWCFAWYEGAIVGFFGVILYCTVGGLGFHGMPGWAIGNIAIGLVLGLALKPVKKLHRRSLQILLASIAAAAAAFIGIELVKSFVDSIVVSQPFAVRFYKNTSSFLADAFVIAASLPLCVLLEKHSQKFRNRGQAG